MRSGFKRGGALGAAGPVRREEMYRTFNMGVGFVLAVPPEQAAEAIAALSRAGTTAWPIGTITPGTRQVRFVPRQ